MTDLGTLDGGTSRANAINSLGQVVGDANGSYRHAFIWMDGVIQDLGMLPGMESCGATAMNDSGEVVGGCVHLANEQAFIWTADTGMTALPIQGAATGINASSHICGRLGAHAFFYHDGVLDDLGPGAARAINDADQIVGYDPNGRGGALHWDDEGVHHLSTLEGNAGFSGAGAINAWGMLAGNSTTGGLRNEKHAVLWTADGISDLGTLGGQDSFAYGMNGNAVVGVSETPSGPRAFVYNQNGPGYMVDLNDLIPPDSGWYLEETAGINSAGQIVGSGYVNGSPHAFLLTTVESAPGSR